MPRGRELPRLAVLLTGLLEDRYNQLFVQAIAAASRHRLALSHAAILMELATSPSTTWRGTARSSARR